MLTLSDVLLVAEASPDTALPPVVFLLTVALPELEDWLLVLVTLTVLLLFTV
jgi:hypothetical protein